MRMLGCVIVLLIGIGSIQGCATTRSDGSNAPVLPPTAQTYSGSADAALAAAKTY